MRILPLAILLTLPAAMTVAQNPTSHMSAPQVSAPRLPVPSVAEEAPPSAFLAAARQAIAANHAGEAIEALERAETRVLARSVRPSLAGIPSDQSLVQRIAAARAALAKGDRMAAIDVITGLLADPVLDHPES